MSLGQEGAAYAVLADILVAPKAVMSVMRDHEWYGKARR